MIIIIDLLVVMTDAGGSASISNWDWKSSPSPNGTEQLW